MHFRHYIIIFLFLLVSCTNRTQKVATDTAEPIVTSSARDDLMKELGIRYIFGDTATIPTHANKQDLDSLLSNLAIGDCYIFTDLYPILDTLPARHEGYPFILADKLEDLGYTYITSGGGNYEHGPRCIDVLYEKDSMQCFVYQAYQYHELQPDSTYNMFIYEEIECKQTNSSE